MTEWFFFVFSGFSRFFFVRALRENYHRVDVILLKKGGQPMRIVLQKLS